MNDTIINFFSKNDEKSDSKWKSNLNNLKTSGFNLADEINQLKPNKVLDVGCGYNEFKDMIPNLVGIDIANTYADVVCDFTDYPCEDNTVDVILALGSVNFISFEKIEEQLAWIYDKLKPGGFAFFRVNPTNPPGDVISDSFYKWTEDDIWYFIDKHNFKLHKNSITKEYLNYMVRNSYRYFFILQK
jgi:SAM-dependent methyltransferase